MARSYWTLFTLVAVVFAATATLPTSARADHASATAPVYSADDANIIKDAYMVVLKDHVDDALFSSHIMALSSFMGGAENPQGNRVKHLYKFDEWMGYAGVFHPDVVEYLQNHENVAFLEKDQMVKTTTPIYLDNFLDSATADIEIGKKKDGHNKKSTLVQTNAPWGLSRISHRSIPSGSAYQEYSYPKSGGANVTVYVIDTGINVKHVEFEGRATWGVTVPENDEDLDGNGHGTHVAGTIGGKTYGVSKNALLVAIKVLSSNGSGTMSDVVKGVEWAVSDHRRRKKEEQLARSVANMSLGGGRSRTLDSAVNGAVRAGVHFAVAAGNDNRDACNSSPAAATDAVTVGATAIDDRMAWFSNHGKCVDVFAPGKDILSTWIGSKTATNTISGTSMASPHVAGLLALLQGQHLDVDYSGKELKELIISLSTKDAIKGLPKKGGSSRPPNWPFPWPPGGGDDDDEEEGKTPNRLIFNGVFSDDETKPTPPELVSLVTGFSPLSLEFSPVEAQEEEMESTLTVDATVTSTGDNMPPGLDMVLNEFIQQTMDRAQDMAEWVHAKMTSITINVEV